MPSRKPAQPFDLAPYIRASETSREFVGTLPSWGHLTPRRLREVVYVKRVFFKTPKGMTAADSSIAVDAAGGILPVAIPHRRYDAWAERRGEWRRGEYVNLGPGWNAGPVEAWYSEAFVSGNLVDGEVVPGQRIDQRTVEPRWHALGQPPRLPPIYVRLRGPNGHLAGVTYGSGLEGRYVADVPCNAICVNARGSSCDCSCGGKNHGAGVASVWVPNAPADVLAALKSMGWGTKQLRALGPIGGSL